MEFDGFPAIWPDGHQWAMATTAYICSRLYTQPPMYRATYMVRSIAQCCATLRNVAQWCAMLRNGVQHWCNVAQRCTALRSVANHCANVAHHISILMKYT